MDIFKNYEGSFIEKSAFKLSNGKKIVEIYGLQVILLWIQFTYFFLSQSVVANVDLHKQKL